MSKLFAGLSSSCCRRRFLALPVSHSRCCGEQVIKSSWCKHGHGSTSTLNVAVPPMTALLSLPHVFVSHMSTYEQKHCVLTLSSTCIPVGLESPRAATSAEYLFRSFVSDMCACAYHRGRCRYHERQGFALGSSFSSSSSSSACSFMAAGLWCLCSYPLLAILISGLPLDDPSI